MAQRPDTESPFLLLFERNPHAMWVFDLRTLRILKVNDAAVERYGWTRDEFLRLTLRDLRSSDTLPALEAGLERLRALPPGGAPAHMGLHEHHTKDGRRLLVEVTTSRISSPEGERVLQMVVDVTGREDAERELRESRARYRGIAESGLYGSGIWHADGRLTEANDTLLVMLGLPAGPGQPRELLWETLIPADRAAEAETNITTLLATGGLRPFETEILRPAGGRLPVMVSASAFEPGGCEGVVLVLDLTRTHRAETELGAQQQRLQGIFANSQDAILLVGTDFRYLDANPAACEMLGYTLEELRRLTVLELVPEEDRPHSLGVREAALAEGHAGGEARRRRRDGTLIDVEYRYAMNIVPGVHLSILRDITDRKRSEAALRATERRLRGIVDAPTIGIGVFRDEGLIVEANAELLRILGRTRAELEAGTLHGARLTPPEQLPRARRAREQATAFGQFEPFEQDYLRPDGSRVPVLLSGGFLPGSRGEGVFVVLDLTERKRAEQESRQRASRLRGFVESDLIGVGIWEGRGRILEANDVFAAMLGYTRDELLARGLRWLDLLPPEHHEADRRASEEIAERGRCTPYQTEFLRRDGSRAPVLVGASRFADEESRGPFFVLDLTELRRTEADLDQHQRRLQALFDNSQDAIVLFDDDGRLLDVSPSCLEIFGYTREEMLGMDAATAMLLDEASAAEAARNRREMLATGRSGGAVRRLRKDGQIVDIEYRSVARIVPGVHLAVLRDVTERRRSVEALRQLSGRLLRLQDEERRRLARELHDSTAQSLAALAIGLAVVGESAGRLDERGRRALEEARALAEQCAREIRTMSYLLHPPLLDELGLIAALTTYADGFAQRSGIRVELRLPEPGTRLPNDVETALFRVVQESLTNIHRHSGSAVASVSLALDAEWIVLEVADRGRGRHTLPDDAWNVVAELGVGIAGMQERIRQLGGRFEFEPGPDGTTVRAMLPRTLA